jgi:hypothetical protein
VSTIVARRSDRCLIGLPKWLMGWIIAPLIVLFVGAAAAWAWNQTSAMTATTERLNAATERINTHDKLLERMDNKLDRLLERRDK